MTTHQPLALHGIPTLPLQVGDPLVPLEP
jgi:hypothetical protein